MLTYLSCLMHKGQTIARRKSTPRKSSWTFSCIFPWTFSGVLQRTFHFSAVCSEGLSLSQRICTGNSPIDFQWHFPMDFHVCDFWRVIYCPGSQGTHIISTIIMVSIISCLTKQVSNRDSGKQG